MKNSFIKLSAFCFILCLSFSSCATIFTKTTYPISISSDPDGADITILDKKGNTVFAGVTPTTVKLSASSGYMSGAKYNVVLSYPGYSSQTVSIQSSLEGWYFGNILIGGLIGMLIVDPASGAMFKLDTEAIYVTFGKNMSEAEKAVKNSKDNMPSFNIIDIKDVPEDMKEYLVKIN